MTTHHAPAKTRTATLATLALAAGIALPGGAALAQSMDELVAAAQAEGALTVYANIDPRILQNLADAFQEEYGIPVDVQRQSSSALAQRFMAEVETGVAAVDIYLSTDLAFHNDRIADGRFEGSLDDVPGMAEWPEEAKWDGLAIIGYVPYSLVWNTNIVTEELDSWEDLADPRWAGQVMMTDPRAGRTSNQFYYLLRDLYGDDFLRTLGENATFSQSAVPGIQQVAAGAQAMYAPGIHQVVVGLIDEGAPLGEAFPEPTISSNNMISIVADAPHPNAARLYVAYAMSIAGQEIINGGGFSPIEGVPNTLEMPEVVEIDPDVAQASTDEFATLMGLQ